MLLLQFVAEENEAGIQNAASSVPFTYYICNVR